MTQNIHVGPGDLDRYVGLEAKREKVWTVRWKEAELDYTEGQEKPGGEMKEVEGTIYKQGQPGSSFSAENGHAEKGTGVLTLTGNVVVQAKDPAVTMRSESVVWDSVRQILVAKGNVRFDDPSATLGPVKELWCSPDLKHVATPDLFSKS